MSVQTWTVLEWSVVDTDLLGARIVCVECEGQTVVHPHCEMCNGDGELFQPYRLPNGAAIDLHRHAELLIQIEDQQSTEPPETIGDET